jgi:hypothetical protein
VLADGYSEMEFGAEVIRDLRRKADNPPVNPDGSEADLVRAIPVLVAPGRYQWETPSRQLVYARDGSPYVSEIRPKR